MAFFGTVYKIVHNQSDVVYIGSTANRLKYRWKQHKDSFKEWISGKRNSCCKIFEYFEKYGIDNFSIIEIMKYQVIDKAHLRAYEQLWINRTRCVNQINAFNLSWILTEREKYREKYRNTGKGRDNESKNREYNIANKVNYCFDCDKTFWKKCQLEKHYESICHLKHCLPFGLAIAHDRKEKKKAWKNDNRDKIMESKRKDYQKNKEAYLERAKKRYQETKEINIYCQLCESEMRKSYWSRHIKTKKHQELTLSQSTP